MNLVDKALEICVSAHGTQLDKAGRLYSQHPIRVSNRVPTLIHFNLGFMTEDDFCVTALLHDVLEDTSMNEEDLVKAGFPAHIIEAVKCLTRHKNIENYKEYIKRVSTNTLARAVKLADLEDNMDMSRVRNSTPEVQKQVLSLIKDRYVEAYLYLLEH